MVVQIIGAGVLAFAVSAGVGKKLVPWLREHDFAQPLKKEVVDAVYSGKRRDEMSFALLQ